MISRKIAVHVALISARIVRENRKPEIWSCTIVHASRKRRCCDSPSHWQAARRILGPAAEM